MKCIECEFVGGSLDGKVVDVPEGQHNFAKNKQDGTTEEYYFLVGSRFIELNLRAGLLLRETLKGKRNDD